MSSISSDADRVIELRISSLEHKRAEPVAKTIAWAQLVKSLSNPAKQRPSKDECKLMKLATFGKHREKKSLRNDKNVVLVYGLEGDYDDAEVSAVEAARRLKEHGVEALVYTSASNMRAKDSDPRVGPRWRVFAPLSTPVEPSQRDALLDRLNGALGGILGSESWTLSQCYYVGRVRGVAFEAHHVEGTCIDLLDNIAPIAKPAGKKATKPKVKGQPGAATALENPIVKFMVKAGLTDGTADGDFVHMTDGCPWRDEHNADDEATNKSVSSYNYVEDFYHCFHATCREAHRTVEDFLRKIGYTKSWLSELTERVNSIKESGEDPAAIVRDLARPRGLSFIEMAQLQKDLARQIKVTKGDVQRDVAAARVELTGKPPLSTHHRLAQEMIDRLKDEDNDVRSVGTEGRIFRCKGNVWQGKLPSDYEGQIAKWFDGQSDKCVRRSDYVSVAEHAYSLVLDEGFFDAAPTGFACPAGLYTLDKAGDVTVQELKPEHRQRFVLDVSPSADAMPLFDKFLAETFAPTKTLDEQAQGAQIELLQEVFGAVLFGLLARHEKVVLLHGAPRGGKGTIVKLAEAMIPDEFCGASSPFNWDGEYYLADLAGKRLNVVGELPHDQPIPAAKFKTVTGRDLLTGRHPTRRPFTFRNEAAHLFSANAPPLTRDRGEAFFCRWLLVDCQNTRLGKEDPNLAARIVKNELPQILAWAIAGAQRLVQRGRFAPGAAHDALLRRWRHATSSVLAFLQDEEAVELEKDDLLGNTKVPFAVLRAEWYSEYEIWCRTSGYRPLGKRLAYEELDSAPAAALGVRVARLKDGFTVCGMRFSTREPRFEKLV